MASYADNLTTAKNNIAAQLAAMTLNPKPSYSIDGESVSWGEHFTNLTNQLLVIEQRLQMADGGFEVRSIGET